MSSFTSLKPYFLLPLSSAAASALWSSSLHWACATIFSFSLAALFRMRIFSLILTILFAAVCATAGCRFLVCSCFMSYRYQILIVSDDGMISANKAAIILKCALVALHPSDYLFKVSVNTILLLLYVWWKSRILEHVCPTDVLETVCVLENCILTRME